MQRGWKAGNSCLVTVIFWIGLRVVLFGLDVDAAEEVRMDAVQVDQLAIRLAMESRAFAGHLTDREGSFLAVLASCAPGDGVILEIGSFKGKSTIILAKADRFGCDGAGVVAVDPLTSPAPTDPSLGGAASCRDAFFGNLERAGVRDRVEFHEAYSHELAKEWSRPIRLLWIDGDHTLEGVARDFEDFVPFLEPGGVVAFHDVMHCSGVTRVFADRVLGSSRFGRSGIVGSIGWAQLQEGGSTLDGSAFRQRRMAAALRGHADAMDRGDSRYCKVVAKLLRWRIPHGSLSAEVFLSRVGTPQAGIADIAGSS